MHLHGFPKAKRMKAKNHNKEATSSDQKNGRQMERTLGVYSVFALCTGAMFSSGFFLLPGIVAADAGASLPFAYLAASLLMFPAIFSMAELSAAIPRSGGPYLFLTRSMGPLIGIIGALGKYLQLLLKGAFAFVGVGAYLSLVMEVSIEPVAIALIVVFTCINIFGVKQTASIEITMVAILLGLLSYFVVAGITEMAADSVRVQERFLPLFDSGVKDFVSAIALVFISYAGVGQVASVAEEVKEPARSLPRGMLYALGAGTFFYFAGTAIMVVLIDQQVLNGNQTPVASAVENFTSLPLPLIVIVVASLAAFLSTGNAVILSAARFPFALARDRLLWQAFGRIGAKGIPKVSVIVTGILLVLLVLTLDVKELAKLAGAFLLFIFMGMCVAVIIFRESRVEEYQPGFRSPLYPWMQVLGVLVYLVLIGFSGLDSVLFIMGTCLAGGLWYFLWARKRAQATAAFYRLLQRIAKESPQVPAGQEIGMPLLGGTNLAHLLERAIVLDRKGEEEDYEEVVQQAADALADHLGGDRHTIAEHLHDELKRWLKPQTSEVAIAPVLLEGIEQPEMVIIRGKITVDGKSLNGLVALVDDEDSSSRLVSLLSQLEAVVFQSGFVKDWKEAENAEELKAALKQDVSEVKTIQFSIEDSGPGASLDGCSLRDADLPDGSLVIMVQRNGRVLVPDGSTALQNKDKVTMLAQADAIDSLRKRFGWEES
ncbi:cationic amino acid transporter [Flammeovirgaceae bacterium 311]|nr:cationic amino acid transporter [Flammeovirgaceae bacterium 311]